MSDSTDKAVEKLTDHVEQLIRAVQKIAPHAWETMVRQVVLVNSLQLVAWLVTVVVAVVLTKQAIRLYRIDPERKPGEYHHCGRSDGLEGMTIVLGVCAGLIAVLAFFMAIFGGPGTIAALINPEYAAGVQLLQVLQ